MSCINMIKASEKNAKGEAGTAEPESIASPVRGELANTHKFSSNLFVSDHTQEL